MLKALIFDFNGVIVESTDTNARIYALLFEPYGPDVVRKVTEHYIQNGGIPRQARIEMYLRDFAGVEPTEELIEKLSARFTKLYLQSLEKAELVPGVREFFEKHGHKYANFLSSGAPQQDIPGMLRLLKLEKYFVKGYGAPKKKAEHIADILKNYGYQPKQVAFIGDSPKDREAATANGIYFIARPRGLKSLENERFKIKDFYDLPAVLEQINAFEG